MTQFDCDLLIVGAGPGGLGLAVEALQGGFPRDRLLVLEKAEQPIWSIRALYPDNKLTTANYKGYTAEARGLLTIEDMSKADTIAFFDRLIAQYQVPIRYAEEVWAIRPWSQGGYLVQSTKGEYRARLVAIAIGIFGRPNKPDYPIPGALKARVHFDLTSWKPEPGLEVLVVGGGDSAGEYVQYLAQDGCRVTLSYRRKQIVRMLEQNREAVLRLAAEGRIRLWLGSNITRLEPTPDGRPRVVFAEPEFDQPVFDHIVYALGGTTPENFLRSAGIAFQDKTPVLDEAFETNQPGLFLVGDLCANMKGGSIIYAFNTAHAVWKRIRERYWSPSERFCYGDPIQVARP
ncbi:MAG: NAD(P)-binding domain-containing protein [Bacteroidetes bacterium]|nr:NAD(P)-binding domain-containing protein [Rhodothermia bacterium]MCS7154992.1 NAD(P)-binding domain-containing protein [Bacteroidota bacterium]MCX7907276.1 NAD(P)-binding domain-containing protein [Bacteroidota bacterium]MDW8137998.1 NAD(P)-binding domain-containing protein [Bacteroidota bacterium]MDW8286150.1 NAD(P)-binding domain-containing protein [Bacteroidota bacterium]